MLSDGFGLVENAKVTAARLAPFLPFKLAPVWMNEGKRLLLRQVLSEEMHKLRLMLMRAGSGGFINARFDADQVADDFGLVERFQWRQEEVS